MSIVLGSKTLPTYVGGLGAYQRLLGELLAANGSLGEVHYVAEDNSLESPQFKEALTPFAVDAVYGQPGTGVKWVEQLLMRLSTRTSSHGLHEMISDAYWRPMLDRRLPREVSAVHFTGTGWDFFGFALARYAQRRGAKFTVMPAVHPRQWGDDQIDVRLYNRADTVFCLSQYELDHLQSLGVKAGKLAVMGLPPISSAEGNGARFRQQHDCLTQPLVYFLGRRDQGKGYPALLQAWKQVVAQAPDAILVLAGPLGQEYAPLLAELPPANLRDLGIPGEATKVDALAACDIFCLPSESESFGIVYVEAWSYGKAVICGTAPACLELIENEVTGLWANQQPAELASAILRLLDTPALREEMGLKGREIQRRKYTSESLLQIHLNAWTSPRP